MPDFRLFYLIAILLSGTSAHGGAPTFTTKSYGTDFPTGYVQTPEGERFLRTAPREFFRGRGAVPAHASLRGRTGPIENQGRCGSCWDFSLTSALRGTLMTSGKDPGRLSFNYLLNCAANAYGCWGGNFAAAEYLVDPRGAPRYGADGEYTGARGACETKPVVGTALRYHVLGSQDAGPSFEDIAYVVGVLKRPVSIVVQADGNWKKYAKGVFNDCTPSSGMNHLVVIEGYDCESAVGKTGNCEFDSAGNLPAGVGTWLIRNSWGEKWGDHGWITTKATDENGRRCNNVASQALYFDVAK